MVGSIKHSLDFIVECLVVQIVNFDCLEVFLRVEIALSD